ncbi:hypothetical protein FEM48_Zijuj03G0009300 [Ziziphus jujuba var. spinosa]|uniref:X8 domain-containing protein n=1 Tax=Ziziphus jujuba var. spinosa TaxID=714518 RepID=A0A978VM97_ZIZJJ|nr:hypothetical protein FEM48_Zijuj03G0009300 [Ziziphus jujuba var. spinosa]
MRLVKEPPKRQSSLFLLTAAKLNLVKQLDSSNAGPYGVSSPFTLPPYDSLPPTPLPENAPPFCLYPPNTPQTPSTAIPTPVANIPPSTPTGFNPNPSGSVPSPPQLLPSPTTYIPSPSGSTLSPPYYEPSPPGFSPSPPGFNPSPPSPSSSIPSPTGFAPGPPSTSVPSPFGFVPSPPVFLPPIVYPPPTTPPSPKRAPSIALWCVAKPSVPDPIIEEAMNYACGSGADCASIQPQGNCFQPNTLFAHASYAFNSYWQRTKVAGGTCEFGGTAMLVTVDPSKTFSFPVN